MTPAPKVRRWRPPLRWLLVLLFVLGLPALSSAAVSFATLCAAPGVIKCIDFDEDSDVRTPDSPNGPLNVTKHETVDGIDVWCADESQHPGTGFPNCRTTVDTGLSFEGPSSMRFTIPSPSTRQGGGTLRISFCDYQIPGYSGPCEMDAGDSFYLMYKQYLGPNYLDFLPQVGITNCCWWKSSNIHWHPATAGHTEITIINHRWTSMPAAYMSGGTLPFRAFYTPYGQADAYYQWRGPYDTVAATGDISIARNGNQAGFPVFTGHGRPDVAQGALGCQYPNTQEPNCRTMIEGSWLTFYWEIAIGTWGGKDSSAKLWFSKAPTEPLQLIIDATPVILQQTSNNPAARFNMVDLTTYMSFNDSLPLSPIVQTWFDNFIVSSQPIADPAGGGGTTYTMTVNVTGNGTVTSTLGGITCPSDCTQSYAEGATGSLNAVADSGWSFSGWSDGCTGTGACPFTMSSNQTRSALFEIDVVVDPVLTVTLAGAGIGTVDSSPAGITCGQDCVESYPSGTDVTLTASPEEGNVFNSWSDGSCGSNPVCVVTLTVDTGITATFDVAPVPDFLLHIIPVGNGTSSITDGTGNILCTELGQAGCTGVFPDQTSVTLTYAPSTGTTFMGWDHASCPGTSPTCVFTVSTNLEVVAFQRTEFNVVAMNFQPAAAPVPAGYLADTGLKYSAAIGQGWSHPLTGDTGSLIDRNVHMDQRFDTFALVQTGRELWWKYFLPNGDYLVALVAGDTTAGFGKQSISIEGTTAMSDLVSDTPNFAVVNNLPVTVSDGELNVVVSSNTGGAKLNFIDVAQNIAGGATTPPPDEGGGLLDQLLDFFSW